MSDEPQELEYEGHQNEYDTGIPAPQKMDVRWLWDYNFLWLEFEANLRGGELKRDNLNKTWKIHIPQDAKPLLNERGIKAVVAYLKANVNIITGSSIMDENRVLQWCERMQIDLSCYLYENMREFDLGADNFLLLVSTFMMAYEANLRKSEGGKALIYAMQNERRITSEVVQNMPPSGLMGRVIGRIGNR